LFGAPPLLTLTPGGALVGVRETFSFRPLECAFLDQKALTLVTTT
jgi:hypothetical protein